MMHISKEKLQNIYNKILIVLSQLTEICVKKLNTLPHKIENIVIGENKLLTYLDRTLTEITENDLKLVATINKYAFYYNKNVVNIVMPDSITLIDRGAF